jgi:hypothetical protein
VGWVRRSCGTVADPLSGEPADGAGLGNRPLKSQPLAKSAAIEAASAIRPADNELDSTRDAGTLTGAANGGHGLGTSLRKNVPSNRSMSSEPSPARWFDGEVVAIMATM